jgi:cytochrome b pre-mRNA-processing protein 6
VDRLRPEPRHKNFTSILRQRVEKPPMPYRDESKEVNAAYLLLDGTFARQYPLSESMMKPASNPTYYEDLKKEILEAPDRSWLSTWWQGMKKMVRFS